MDEFCDVSLVHPVSIPIPPGPFPTGTTVSSLTPSSAWGASTASSGPPEGADPLTWRPDCLLDFADTFAGDPLFDLVALHVSVLRCDTVRLAQFLDLYEAARGAQGGWTRLDRARLPYIMTCLMLLHPVDAMQSAVYFKYQAIMGAASLIDVQNALWGLPA